MTLLPTQEQDPRILLVSHNFPPTIGPESYLVNLNALALRRAGMDVTVLTTSHEFRHTRQKLDEAPLKSLPQEIKVLRTPSYDAWLKDSFPRVGGLSVKLLESTVLPESYFMWLPTAVPAGLQHLQSQPSIIYSRAQKHVSNVCGWRLKRLTGLPWVAHFSDIWLNHYLTSPLIRGIARALERRILRDADKVVFVTQRAVDIILPQYPAEWKEKVVVIPHGYQRSVPTQPLTTPGKGPLRLIHAGVFYPRMRTPETLFRAIQKLHLQRPLQGRLLLTLLGDQSDEYQHLADTLGIRDLVEFKPSVPHTQCQELIARSDLPVMIDTLGHGGVFLPSKLIEYFAFQKPVLAITETDSAVSLILKDCGLPVADMMDSDQTAGVLGNFLAHWESGQWALSQATASKMAGYQIDQVNEPLFGIMRDLWQGFRATQIR